MQRQRPAPRRHVARVADQAAQPLLERQHGGRAQHQERHDQVERPRRGGQQQRAARSAGADRPTWDRAAIGRAAALSAPVREVAPGCRRRWTSVPGEDRHRVRDVGRHRRSPVAIRAGKVISDPPPAIALTAPAASPATEQEGDVGEDPSVAASHVQARRTSRPGGRVGAASRAAPPRNVRAPQGRVVVNGNPG